MKTLLVTFIITFAITQSNGSENWWEDNTCPAGTERSIGCHDGWTLKLGFVHAYELGYTLNGDGQYSNVCAAYCYKDSDPSISCSLKNWYADTYIYGNLLSYLLGVGLKDPECAFTDVHWLGQGPTAVDVKYGNSHIDIMGHEVHPDCELGENVNYNIYSNQQTSTISDNRQCIDCPAGEFQTDVLGVSSPYTPCQECPAGEYQPDPAQSSCPHCESGKYAEGTGNTACQVCPEGYVSRGETDRTYCVECNSGEYQDQTTQGSCKSCDTHWTTHNDAFTGGVGAKTACTPSAAGYQANGDHTAAVLCTTIHANGGYYSGIGEVCTACSAGEYSWPSGQGCSACPAGKHSTNPPTNDCTTCPAGKYSSNGAGQTGSTECHDCVPGKWSNAEDSVCDSCLAGQYSNAGASQHGSTGCTDCAAGYYSTGSNSACTACAAGKRSIKGAGQTGSTDCTDCGIGYYSTGTGNDQCTICPDGTYSSNGFNQGASTGCTTVDPGYAAASGDSQATECPAGTFTSTAGQAACAICPAGTYSNAKIALGQSSAPTICSACPKGKYSSAGAKGIHFCKTCNDGTKANAASYAMSQTECEAIANNDPQRTRHSDASTFRTGTCSWGIPSWCSRTEDHQYWYNTEGVCGTGHVSAYCGEHGDRCNGIYTKVQARPKDIDGTLYNVGDGWCYKTLAGAEYTYLGTGFTLEQCKQACDACTNCLPDGSACSTFNYADAVVDWCGNSGGCCYAIQTTEPGICDLLQNPVDPRFKHYGKHTLCTGCTEGKRRPKYEKIADGLLATGVERAEIQTLGYNCEQKILGQGHPRDRDNSAEDCTWTLIQSSGTVDECLQKCENSEATTYKGCTGIWITKDGYGTHPAGECYTATESDTIKAFQYTAADGYYAPRIYNHADWKTWRPNLCKGDEHMYTVDECADLCNEDEDCTQFAVMPKTGGACVQIRTQFTDTGSGYVCNPSGTQNIGNPTATSIYSATGTASVQECADRCKAHGLCVYFSYGGNGCRISLSANQCQGYNDARWDEAAINGNNLYQLVANPTATTTKVQYRMLKKHEDCNCGATYIAAGDESISKCAEVTEAQGGTVFTFNSYSSQADKCYRQHQATPYQCTEGYVGSDWSTYAVVPIADIETYETTRAYNCIDCTAGTFDDEKQYTLTNANKLCDWHYTTVAAVTLEDCAQACQNKEHCYRFSFGTEGYSLIQADHECSSTHTQYGDANTLIDCRNAVMAGGGTVFDWNEATDDCWVEHVEAAGGTAYTCTGGGLYTFYAQGWNTYRVVPGDVAVVPGCRLSEAGTNPGTSHFGTKAELIGPGECSSSGGETNLGNTNLQGCIDLCKATSGCKVFSTVQTENGNNPTYADDRCYWKNNIIDPYDCDNLPSPTSSPWTTWRLVQEPDDLQCPVSTGNYNGNHIYEFDRTTCTDCPQASYIGTPGSNYCADCPIGTQTSGAAAGAISYNAACSSCPESTYNDEVRQLTCKNCPAGTDVVQGVGGTYGTDAAGDCTACVPGKYRAETDDSPSGTCIDCPAGMYQTVTGWHHCNACDKGWYQDQTGQATCKVCSENGYTDETQQNTCKSCAAGYQNAVDMTVMIGGSFTGIINNCLQFHENNGPEVGPYAGQGAAGQYLYNACAIGAADSTHACTGTGNSWSDTACAIGRVLSSSGNTCEVCKAGTFDTGTTCQACPAGEYATGTGNTACTPCPAGTSSTGTGNAACDVCPAGTYQTQTGQTGCTACVAGRYSDATQATSNVCQDCDAGKYNTGTGNDQCYPCGAGTYQTLPAQTGCTACAEHTYSAATGQDSASTCLTTCAAGGFSSAGYKLPSGTANTACVACAAGEGVLDHTNDATTCESCPYAQVSTLGSGCDWCALGHFALTNPAHQSCVTCDAGYWNDDAGRKREGANSEEACYKCPLGEYSYGPGNSACTPCPANEYQDVPGQDGCKACDRGRFTTGTGNSQCAFCAPGTQAKGAGAGCDDCGTGKFSDKHTLDVVGWLGTCFAQPQNILTRTHDWQTKTARQNVEYCYSQCTLHTAGQYTMVSSAEASASEVVCRCCGGYAGEASYSESGMYSGLYLSDPYQSYAQSNPSATGDGSKHGFGIFDLTVGCQDCAAGTVQPSTAQASCNDCLPAGTKYQDQTGQTTCKDCAVCTNGATRTACQAASPGACDQCEAGKGGAQSSTLCEWCEHYKYNEAATAITQTCADGDCPVGEGYEYGGPSAAPTCTPCTDGYYSDSAATGVCVACPAGKIATGTGNSQCTTCAKGTYANTATAATACVTCTAPKTTQHSGASDASECKCAIDTYWDSGSSACVACTEGYYRTYLDQATCTACSAGTIDCTDSSGNPLPNIGCMPFISIIGDNPASIVQNSGNYIDLGAICFNGLAEGGAAGMDGAWIEVSGDIVDATDPCGTTFSIYYDCKETMSGGSGDAPQVSRTVEVTCP